MRPVTAHQPGRQKYVWRRGRFRASPSSAASYLLTDLVAGGYEQVFLEDGPRQDLGRLLDLGCGSAPLRQLYRQADAIVFADMERRDEDLRPFVGLDAARSLPFRDQSFDTVLISDVLEHLQDPVAAMHEIARVLRPGGLLVGNTPYLYWIHEEPFDYWRPSRYALELLLQSAGFVDVEVSELGGSIEVVVDLVSKHLGALGPVGARLGAGTARVTATWTRSRAGRRCRRATQAKYPIAHLFVAHRRAG